MATFTINNEGAAPIANRDVANALRGQTIVIDALINDIGHNLPILITSVTVPNQGGTVTIVNGGTELQYTSDSGYVGDETFTYTITDSEGLTSSNLITVTVTN